MEALSSPASSRRSQPLADLDLNKISNSKVQSADAELTPPVTPVKSVRKGENSDFDHTAQKGTVAADVDAKVQLFDGSFELGAEIGRGAWSKVYAAHEKSIKSDVERSQQLPTPPGSPASVLLKPSCYAIKVPSHSLALSVMKHEALVLSRLSRFCECSSYVVRFHGFHPSTNSIVLSRASQTLQSLAGAALLNKKTASALRPASDPVIGLRLWLDIALQLVQGLTWMHSVGVIHGDIKASNVLLLPFASSSPSSTISEEYIATKAIYCDFSSARLTASTSDSTSQPKAPLPIDALTTSYAAPELLRLNASVVAAEASDVFALGVTLVVAAIGEDPYVHARHDMQKLGLAREGMVLEGVGMGGWRAAMRVRRGCLVEKGVRNALAKQVDKRIGVEEWIEVLKGLVAEAENKEGVGDS